ncbi:hypothetical protein BH11PLA2_BH11PLA2_09350 [soil metagenome]
MKTIEVTVSDRHAALIDQFIADGYADSFDDAVSAAIATLANEDHLIAALDAGVLREKLAVGRDQIARGEVIDGDKAFIRIETMLETLCG